MKQQIMTIHEVRSKLDHALDLATIINARFLDGALQDPSDLKNLYENLRSVCSSRWTNTLL